MDPQYLCKIQWKTLFGECLSNPNYLKNLETFRNLGTNVAKMKKMNSNLKNTGGNDFSKFEKTWKKIRELETKGSIISIRNALLVFKTGNVLRNYPSDRDLAFLDYPAEFKKDLQRIA
jgi:hypothetical protein